MGPGGDWRVLRYPSDKAAISAHFGCRRFRPKAALNRHFDLRSLCTPIPAVQSAIWISRKRSLGQSAHNKQAVQKTERATSDTVVHMQETRCTRHPQNPAHQRKGAVTTDLDHEGVLHSGSLAKYRAAFFERSRSSSSRRKCERRRIILLLTSGSSFDGLADQSGVGGLTHFYKLCANTPKRTATSGTR